MNPVQSLQHMLNQIAHSMPVLPGLSESGEFDEATLEAVMLFQRETGLPVTGIVDQALWDAIFQAYTDRQLQHGTPPPVRVHPGHFYTVEPGETSDILLPVQAMFHALSGVLSNFEPCPLDRQNSGGTQKNLRLLRSAAQLEPTDRLDRAAWSYLVRLYEALITRQLR